MDEHKGEEDDLKWEVCTTSFTDHGKSCLRGGHTTINEETENENGHSSVVSFSDTLDQIDEQQESGGRPSLCKRLSRLNSDATVADRIPASSRYNFSSVKMAPTEGNEFFNISFDTTPNCNDNAERTDTRTPAYEVTISGYLDVVDSESDSDSDSSDHRSEQQQNISQKASMRIKRQISITCYEDDCPSDTEDCHGDKGESEPRKHVSSVTVEFFDETEEENMNVENEKDNCCPGTKCDIQICATPDFDVCTSEEEIAQYCFPLPNCQFQGQTTSHIEPDEYDKSVLPPLHLGFYLEQMDNYLRCFDPVTEFTGTDEYYLQLLRHIATFRHLPDATEDECYESLLADSERFVGIYHRRGKPSEIVKEHKTFWGTRQQLLSGKVIADWVDKANGPLDPIFGVLLQPTTGRTGPGDSDWLHHILYDNHGPFAYHSAVHDAFGYLKTAHEVGPGYDYLSRSLFKTNNPLAGQYSGTKFWKSALEKIPFTPTLAALTNQFVSMHLGWHPEKCNNAESGKIFVGCVKKNLNVF